MRMIQNGWGQLLLDRFMLENHINPHQVGNLNRLAQDVRECVQERLGKYL